MCCREARKEQLLFSDIIWGWNWADNVTLWLPAYFSIFIYLDGIDREGSSEGMYTKAPVATVCIVLLLELLLPKPSIYLQSSHGRIGFTPGSSKPTFKKKLWPLYSAAEEQHWGLGNTLATAFWSVYISHGIAYFISCVCTAPLACIIRKCSHGKQELQLFPSWTICTVGKYGLIIRKRKKKKPAKNKHKKQSLAN